MSADSSQAIGGFNDGLAHRDSGKAGHRIICSITDLLSTATPRKAGWYQHSGSILCLMRAILLQVLLMILRLLPELQRRQRCFVRSSGEGTPTAV